MEEVEVSPPEPMEIRVKVVCTSLCRSDITAWSQVISSPFFSFLIPNSFLLIRPVMRFLWKEKVREKNRDVVWYGIFFSDVFIISTF